MEASQYGAFVATRRFVQPLGSFPEPRGVGDVFETSYQHAFFAQRDAPRACDPRCATKPIRGQRPVATIDRALHQSGTNAGDFESIAKSSYRHPKGGADGSSSVVEAVRFPRMQNPKPVPVQFPSTIERTRVRGK